MLICRLVGYPLPNKFIVKNLRKTLRVSLKQWLTRVSLMACITLCSLACTGQNAWKGSEAKGVSTVFKSEINMGSIYIKNTQITDSCYLGREEYNPESIDFSFVRLTSHDAVLNAFRKAFSEEEIEMLSVAKERISIFPSVDEKGLILRLSFSIREDTRILPTQMEVLEKELLQNMKFDIVGKRINNPIFYSSSFRVYFSEIEHGEIRSVRNSVNFKAPNEM